MPVVPPPPSLQNAYPRVYAEFYSRATWVARQVPGTRATSWWRSRSENTRVGGAAKSQHLVGTAVDFVSPNKARTLAAVRAAGLVAIDEGDHIHVQAFRQSPTALFALV